MPYKDKGKQKKAVKEAVVRHRKGITRDNDVIPDVLPETVPASYVYGVKKYKFLQERPRFLTLDDGQTFDRTYQPVPDQRQGMAACNDTHFSDLGLNRAVRLAMLHNKND